MTQSTNHSTPTLIRVQPTPAAPDLHPQWTTYTAEDGLAWGTVYAIAVGGEGALWFGTNDGVSRFDGENWTTYTAEDGLVHNKVLAIAVDGEGALWFGTLGGGVSRYLPPD